MSKILFIGDLNQYGRGYQRYRTLKEMGHDVVAYSHTYVSEPNKIRPPTLLYKIFWKLRIPLDDMGVNFALRREIKKNSFDVIWIEKGNMIWPWTLKHLKRLSPNSALISCSEDDMFVRHGHSLWYRWGVCNYDIVFTTKTYNLNELLSFGVKRTVLFLDSYDEQMHKQISQSKLQKNRFSTDVSAVGAFENERAMSILYLAQNGIKVTVWGNGWGGWVDRHPNLDVRNEFLFGEDYSRAICASKININFLRKINRDEVTSRSVEIPACGRFMLAERTERHSRFFEEGIEAEFFSSNQELLEKVRIFLQKDLEREKIAMAGYLRCIKSGYSMRAQLSTMLSQALNV
jgi:hypothetical protein